MEHNIVIHADGRSTDISLLKTKCAFSGRIELKGKGSLESCMITFLRNGERVAAGKDVLFVKPLHQKSQTLLPHLKKFLVSDFDLCSVEIFGGNILDGDEIILFVSSEAEA